MQHSIMRLRRKHLSLFFGGLILSTAFQSSVAAAGRYYEKLTETCVNSVITTRSVDSLFKCGGLCESNAECSAFCFSAADATCTLHKIHDFGAGNVEVGLRSYKYISTEYNHYNAFYHCIGLGARMVLPMSYEEERFVYNLAGRKTMFIGSDDITTEGQFLSSGYHTITKVALTYWTWSSGEPNNSGGEDCVVLDDVGWNDEDCDRTEVTVCRAPAPEMCTQLPNAAFPGLRCYKRIKKSG